MVLVDIDAYIEASCPNDDTATTYDGNLTTTPPPISSSTGSRRSKSTSTPSSTEVSTIPKTIPLGQRLTNTKTKRKKLPSTVATPTGRSRGKKMSPLRRTLATRTGSQASQFLSTSLRNGEPSSSSSSSQLPTIEETSITQSDSEVSVVSSSLRSGGAVSDDDDDDDRHPRDWSPVPKLQPTLPEIVPIASWEYSSSSGGSSSCNNSDGPVRESNKRLTRIPLTVVTTTDVRRSSRRTLSSPRSSSRADTDADTDTDTAMTPKRSNITTTTDSPTTIMLPNEVRMFLRGGEYSTDFEEGDIENSRCGGNDQITDQYNDVNVTPSISNIGCMRYRNPTIIARNEGNENRTNHDGTSSSSASSSSASRFFVISKWERICKFRTLLYSIVFSLLVCIVILSVSVVTHNKRSNSSNNTEDWVPTIERNYTSPSPTNYGYPPATAPQTAVPEPTPVVSDVATTPPAQSQQTAVPLSVSPPTTASTTLSPVLENMSTPQPTSSEPNLTAPVGDGEIQYKRRVPLLSMNCGGPTLNMISTRETVNSSNETSIKNSTLIWESDVFYNTDYYYGSSRIRSKSNVDSCRNYIIPDFNDSDAESMFLDSIDVFDDRNLDALYCTERFFQDGFSGYEIPVDEIGRYYRIELYMMESFHNEINERVFDIVIEDEILEKNFDIFKTANGKHNKVRLVYTVFVSDSSLSISFNASINYPLINAISIHYLLQE